MPSKALATKASAPGAAATASTATSTASSAQVPSVSASSSVEKQSVAAKSTTQHPSPFLEYLPGHGLGPGAPSVVPDGGAAQVAASRRASIRRQSQLFVASVAAAVSAAAPESTVTSTRTHHKAARSADDRATPELSLSPEDLQATKDSATVAKGAGGGDSMLRASLLPPKSARSDSLSSLTSLLSGESVVKMEELMNSLLQAEPVSDLELEDRELHERLSRELSLNTSPDTPATGVYWTEPLADTPAAAAKAIRRIQQAVDAEQRLRQSPEESWRCGAALSFTRQIYAEFRKRLAAVRARSPLARTSRRTGDAVGGAFSTLKVSTDGQRGKAGAIAGPLELARLRGPDSTGGAQKRDASPSARAAHDSFGTIEAPAVLTTMHLNWGIGQEVPVRHKGRNHRGNVVAIGGYNGSAVLIQFFDGEGEMLQQLHRSSAPYPSGFNEGSWIADVKAPHDDAAAAAVEAAKALAVAGGHFDQKQRRASGPNQKIVSVYSRPSPRTSPRGGVGVRSLSSALGSSVGRSSASQQPKALASSSTSSAQSSAAAPGNLEEFPELDTLDTDLIDGDLVDEEPSSLLEGPEMDDEFAGLDGDALDFSSWSRRSSSISALNGGGDSASRAASISSLFAGLGSSANMDPFEISRMAQELFAANATAAGPAVEMVPDGAAPPGSTPNPNSSVHTAAAVGEAPGTAAGRPRIQKKRSRRTSVFSSTVSLASTANIVGKMKRALSQARRLSGKKNARNASVTSIGSLGSDLGDQLLDELDIAALELEESRRDHIESAATLPLPL